MDFLDSFFGRNGLLPHGICFTWSPPLLWSMVGADVLIAVAYFSIPVSIARFMRHRADFSLAPVAALFVAFIFACGVTHVMDVWTIWQPDYGVQAVTKMATAVLSLATAVMLWRLLPQALAIPGVAQLQRVIRNLEDEVARRRSAEETLAEVQQSLAATLASIGAGFLATDREGRVTRMNSVAEQVLGWPQAEALGRSVWEVFDREGRPAEMTARNPIDVILEQGWTVDVGRVLVAISRQGEHTPVEVKAAPTYADDGSVRGLVVVFRDQTATLQAEAASGRLAAIVESSNDAIIGKTLDGRITSWNRAAEVMFGYGAEQAVGQPVQMLIPPEIEAEEMRILADLSRGETVPPFNTQRRAADGRLLDVSLSISPIRNVRGQIIGASKIVRDVTLQRRAEAALRESEARLRFTLESAQIGDWDLDLASGVIQRSPLFDRCLGYAQPQPDWRFESFVQHLHPEDRADVLQRHADSLASQSDWGAECRVLWPDGSVHWLGINASVRAERGRPVRMLGIVVDITERKQAEAARLTAQRLEAENRQVLEANRLKSQFLANMSHELRTPLNAIIGFADLLHAGVVPPASPKHHEYLGHIASSGRHLLQLINDVLDLSKVESGKFEFFPQPVQLPQLVNEVRDVLHTALQRKHLDLRIEIDPTLGELVLDPARLKQALYNYLSNAIKFTPDRGRITVRALPEGAQRWRLEVQDTGMGIAAADLPRLFTEFMQLDAGYSKQHQGTGLGLALTRRLVEAQGGSVGVRSQRGEGSVFHLVLDRVLGSSPADLRAGAPGRLLVIEHDGAQQRRLTQALADAGFAVDTAGSGADALRQALTQAYAAITLNLALPEAEGGLGVLAGIRSQGLSRAAPVVGLSMNGEAGSAASFAVADVLAKPLRTDELLLALGPLRRQAEQPARVLVVDDDPMALDLMQASLVGMGLQAFCVADGRQALREIGQHRPDAIILDLMMPGFDGFAVLDALRQMPAWRHVPVYVWTSMSLNADEVALLAGSAQAILGKGGGGLQGLLEGLRLRRPAQTEGVQE